ncbi:ABC transporter ATP-binding protein [Caldalkalibacillus salinus]|uniref:ABC transporter ATP-binding protein n=1 Tax=Caldalkalibacillus salinus TaxID=2803787 RepID=UPI0019219883|nr:ABC transporter ATP-binding protein [Caldalkalibacillus salinus]
MEALKGTSLTLGYGQNTIIDDLNISIPKGKVTVLIGSNGCGKSTLLRSLARLLKPEKGSIVLDGLEIAKLPTRDIAKRMAILPQNPVAPEGLTVLQLVKQGRYPHQSWLKQWTDHDEKVVTDALAATHLQDLADRPVDSLSGGQRQRAWIAMTLAQDTDTILLDEPTTYLDIAHQIDILDLLYDLNHEENKTIVMVLHDINLACRYADHIVAVHNKGIYAQGEPNEIISQELIHHVFGMDSQVTHCPIFGSPLCIPYGKKR